MRVETRCTTRMSLKLHPGYLLQDGLSEAKGFFEIFKRGMRGIYQHCKEKHLHRYVPEFDFRYNHRVKLGFMT